ncbi:MAG: hypothetical protein LBS11_04300, partial [Oscillospiraceae bacterium]|nr:hypothetical protein [Oscillospiraceae bacterium]
MLFHAHLPGGLALNLGLKEYRDGGCLKESLLGLQGKGDKRVLPGLHDGGYTSLELHWRGVRIHVESLAEGDSLLLLATPLEAQAHLSMLTLESGMLLNRPGGIRREGNTLHAQWPGGAAPAACAASRMVSPSGAVAWINPPSSPRNVIFGMIHTPKALCHGR